MKCFFKIVVTSIILYFLVSCTTTQSTKFQHQVKSNATTNGLFDAWNDTSIKNAAAAELIKQADLMMKYKQWDEAQSKLERALRVSITYAPTWSRLSWLALRAAKHNKAIHLAERSNSYTNARDLQYLNWSFIRDANKLMGKNREVDAANKKIQQLRSSRL